MCTVSIVPGPDDMRLVCNRDEQRSRAPARLPERVRAGRLWARRPVDPESGGTWIGVNDAGLVLALLNRAARTTGADPAAMRGTEIPARAGRSRGLVIPALLACDTLDAVRVAALALDPSVFQPFRLLALLGRTLLVVSSDGRAVDAAGTRIDRPLLFTSSSLGDRRAAAWRRPLFERLVLEAPDSWRAGQRRFHAHRWPHEPGLSVVMSRPDARTVSRTTIDLWRDGMRLVYEGRVA